MDESDIPKKAESLQDLAKLYEVQAAQTIDDQQRLTLYKKAAAAHHKLGAYPEEIRCLSLVCKLLEGEEKVDCLLSKWDIYITAIAVYKYETSYEWKGESENLDPRYEETLREYCDGAVDVLDEVLRMKGVDRKKLHERLYAECIKRRNDGGWGESECFTSIEKSFKGSSENSKQFL